MREKLKITGVVIAKIVITILMCLYCTSPVQAQAKINSNIDSCAYYKRKLDTTMHQLYMSRMQINAAKFYIKICQKRPTNKKFFYGWMTQRAIVDKPSFDPSPIIIK
jgi:hypothetical protein